MNPRERILATLSHEAPDRTPTDAWFHREVTKMLLDYYKTDDFEHVLKELGIEGWYKLGPWIEFPDFEKIATERPGGGAWRPGIWKDARTYEDEWGVVYKLGDGDWYEERVSGPLESAERVEEILDFDFPTVDQVREPEGYAERIAEKKKQELFVSAGIPNPYKTAWQLRGMDNILADYLINPEMLDALYDKLYELYTELCLRMVRADIDMITVTGDVAMQDRIIMGPDSWRRVDKPRLARLIEICRNVKSDVFFFIHSDGDVTDIMDDLVEIGFNVINPIQPECMDPFDVKKRWGNRITMHGGISIQKTLPFGTAEEVRREVEELIQGCGYDGGLVVFPSNVIQPDTPIENIIDCFHAARDYPVQKLGGKPGM